MNFDLLVRPNIRTLKPYHSARQDFLNGVLLDANENAFGSVLKTEDISLNRYPDPFQHELRKRLAELNNVSPENLFVGVGSDEVIDLLVRIFCEPQRDAVLLLEPTYGMYRVAASVQNALVDSCLLTEDFQIDLPSVKAALRETTKLIFCCSPNNPTANLLRTQDILELCKLGPLVVVDEAYIDFAQTPSISAYFSEYPNLIVMRTLSKAWGLAGIRLGYCIADPLIISYMMKVKSPYNINSLTSKAALVALQNVEQMRATVQSLLQERKWLQTELCQLPDVIQIFPSDANFLLVRVQNATVLYQELVKRNIIIRNRSTEPRLENCVRITVGTHEENELLLRAWREIMQ